MDVLCSDKTGTLTRGAVDARRSTSTPGAPSRTDVLRWACINSALESGIRSPLDAAILAHDHPAIADYTKRAELPFDFERRRVSVLVDGPDGLQVVTKGAPEGDARAAARRSSETGAVVPFDAAMRAERRADVRAAEPGGLPPAGSRAQARPSPRQDRADGRRRARPDPVRVRRLPRSARPLGARDAGSAAGQRRAREDPDRRRRADHPDDLRRRSASRPSRIVLGAELERMSDDALVAVAEQDRRLRARLAGPEEPDHPRAEAQGPRRRLHRRRDQRRAVAPRRRRRDLGLERRGRGEGGGRHHPAREEPGGDSARRDRGAQELRQHHQVRADGHAARTSATC